MCAKGAHAARRAARPGSTRRASSGVHDHPANRKAHRLALEALREAGQLSDGMGVPRKVWAKRMGYTVGAVGEWIRRGRLPSLVELLIRDDVLPREARELLLQRIVDKSGLVVSKRPDGCGRGSMEAQMLAMTASMGLLAQRIESSIAPGSDGGESVTPLERGRLIEAATALLKQAAGLSAALERVK